MVQMPITVDLSSALVAVVGFLLVFLGKRAVKTVDTNFDSIRTEIGTSRTEAKEQIGLTHTRIDKLKDELTQELQRTRIDVKETQTSVSTLKDKTSDMVTAVRLDLENKLEVHDTRLRDLEKK